jgi:2-methylcitrate dehydratase PrpD
MIKVRIFERGYEVMGKDYSEDVIATRQSATHSIPYIVGRTLSKAFLKKDFLMK